MRGLKKELENIAKECLDIETIKRRWSDELDFHEVSVWSIEEALKRAYKLGYDKGLLNTENNKED